MPLVVEDGTGLPNADSYLSVADLRTYAGKFSGVTPPENDAELERPLRVATAWNDATYRGRLSGCRRRMRDQSLEWPRVNAFDREEWPVDYASVPPEVISATAEAALREMAVPGSLSPDLKRGGAIKRVKADTVEVEYSAAATANTVFSTIDNLMGPLLCGGATGLVGRAVRG